MSDKEYTFSRIAGEEGRGGIFKDVAFNRHSMQDGKHVSPFDNGRIPVGGDDIVVKLVQGIEEESFKRTLSKATRATIGIDLTVPDDDTRSWEEMLQGGLQTALETQVIVFEVAGVSRACTHQLVRTRKAAFHQQSMRASWYGEHPETRIPESVFNNEAAREAFELAVKAAHHAYEIACDMDISYQDARYVLPEGTTNYILLEYPVREFLNVYAYRACSMFQWEIVTVMRKCREELVKAHPWLEPYVKISCENTGAPCSVCNGTGKVDFLADEENGVCGVCNGSGKVGQRCTFQGWEEVEDQCDFPWAREDNRTFVSKLHAIKKGKA